MTATTHLAVFYATDSKILRRKVIPDDDMPVAQLRAEPGESVLLLPLTRPYDDTACRAAIADATGCKPPSGRCCVVDRSGNVVAVCNADPAQVYCYARRQTRRYYASSVRRACCLDLRGLHRLGGGIRLPNSLVILT
jgi:hypothetical protein